MNYLLNFRMGDKHSIIFANYPKYNTSELLIQLFKNNPYVGLEENGREFFYRSDNISAASMNKTRIA